MIVGPNVGEFEGSWTRPARHPLVQVDRYLVVWFRSGGIPQTRDFREGVYRLDPVEADLKDGPKLLGPSSGGHRALGVRNEEGPWVRRNDLRWFKLLDGSRTYVYIEPEDAHRFDGAAPGFYRVEAVDYDFDFEGGRR